MPTISMQRQLVLVQGETMGVYKDITIPDELDQVIHQMREVDGYREELSSLGQQWDLLTILGQMSGDGIDMSATREAFKQLTGDLLSNLGLETLRKTLRKLTAKAQVAVDIVVRNLFERTADIGFLATDHDIRDFLRGSGDQATLEARFREYVSKYSVYDNVILIGLDGQIKAQIDHSNGLTQTSDPVVGDCLKTTAAYVEFFRSTELAPEVSKKLVYAYRVTETDDPRSKPLGVLCLCFRFENEMEGVFRNLSGEHDWECITLLDGAGRVIASSDGYQIPVGAKVDFVLDEPFRVVKFAGREYLSKTCATKGYQGYMGPGWFGHVMIALDQAFVVREDSSKGLAEPTVMRSVLESQRLFSPEIRRIPRDAERIQRDLDRSVWNGNVRQEGISHEENNRGGANANKVLLWEISKTGARTKSVFERSISNLRTMVVSSILYDVHFLASLANDIMDRNLYERANDCRWWALTSAFRLILSKPTVTADDRRQMSEILSYINGLYTVYTNLLVFDRSGTVLAVSNPSHQGLVGRPMQGAWVQEALSNNQSQWYTASPFEASELYGGSHTYVYAASISRLDDPRRNVGGIGIVFDSAPQFRAMLEDCLPRDGDGTVLQDAFAVFVDRHGTVISSTHSDVRVGEKFSLDAKLLSFPGGQGQSSVVTLNGQYYAMGVHASAGYREYKGAQDPYKNDVVAVVCTPLAEAIEMVNRESSSNTLATNVKTSHRVAGAKQVEIATFFVGDHWLGVNAQWIVEAVSMDEISRVPHASPGMKGVMKLRDTVLPVLSIHEAMNRQIRFDAEETQIVVLKTEMGLWGLIVDHLGPIPTLDPSQIDTESSVVKKGGAYVAGLVKPSSGSNWSQLLIVVEPEELRKVLLSGNEREFLSSMDA